MTSTVHGSENEEAGVSEYLDSTYPSESPPLEDLGAIVVDPDELSNQEIDMMVLDLEVEEDLDYEEI